jgi:hypothetical protein
MLYVQPEWIKCSDTLKQINFKIQDLTPAARAALVSNPWLQLWAPHHLAWWIALSFIIGSACFGLGSFVSNWPHYSPAWSGDSAIINTRLALFYHRCVAAVTGSYQW